MKAKRVKGMLDRQLEDPKFRKRFEKGYAAFLLEVAAINTKERRLKK